MMPYREALEIGIENVLSHKLRSALTTLGVIFGVAAVVSMLSIGEGARRSAIEQIRQLGTNNIRVRQVQLTGAQADLAEKASADGLTYLDAQTIAAGLPNALGVSPLRYLEADIARGSKDANGHVVGTDDGYQRITHLRPAEGRFISALDVRDAKRVCVIGADVRKDLFGFADPINRRIKIDDTWFTVVGLMGGRNLKGGSGPIRIRDINRDIYIPITAALKRFTDPDHPQSVDEIAVQVADQGQVVATAEVVKRMIRRTHRGAPDFEIVIPAELLAQSQRTQRLFNVVMGSIAAISLLVGGIGIMNIMLASVTERTREIGIRRAVGATERDVMNQFLNETVLVSVGGGLIGIMLGAIMAKAINLFAGWQTVISFGSVIVSFGISAVVGIVFGLYPARRAARLDPVEALRYE
ncbi:MAG: FtsX-like permease family protein [Candidatus Eisenbacteria bacterium]|uniref:FtsX-like permease family protein n=1 Tax=Eiseniibacteriota bacterium TaxID=2212470 RepID=A0A538U3A7_UNCEI|nr:MAG: FtsX-like permease family protein [Candidatus Eisenbacteria bacterium]